MVTAVNVGKRITDLREKKNITTNKLANMAGISQSYLREVEMERKNPTVEMLSYICYALNISLKEFFTVEQNSIEPSLMMAIEKLSETEQQKLADFIMVTKK